MTKPKVKSEKYIITQVWTKSKQVTTTNPYDKGWDFVDKDSVALTDQGFHFSNFHVHKVK